MYVVHAVDWDPAAGHTMEKAPQAVNLTVIHSENVSSSARHQRHSSLHPSQNLTVESSALPSSLGFAAKTFRIYTRHRANSITAAWKQLSISTCMVVDGV